MIYVSNSESQTINFASRFSKKVKLGSVIALIGNLGSGKTTFVKELLSYKYKFNDDSEIKKTKK